MSLIHAQTNDRAAPDLKSVSSAGDEQPSKHVVILGAGPAGLTAAYELVVHHRLGVCVLEKDSRYVGGISRTVEQGGYRFDIGGHRFFSKCQEIEDLWTEIMGEDLLVRPRLSRIIYRGKYFDYPLKAFNALRNLGPLETVLCLLSYLRARLFPVQQPRSLQEWVTNQFGHRLFRIFFKTYTEKVWGISTRELSADWAAQRIKGLSLSEAIKNALWPQRAKGRGAVIKTLIDEFRYPRRGPGELWERTAALIAQRGYPVLLDQEVVSIRHDGSQVSGVVVRDSAGNSTLRQGTHYISTLPMRELVRAFDPPLPEDVQQAAERLKYRDFLTVALIVNRADLFPDNWIYLHDPEIVAGRIQNFKNWSSEMVPDPATTCLGLEYFCFEGDGLWTSGDEELVKLASQDLQVLKLCQPAEILGGVVVRQAKAYPVYDDGYTLHVRTIRDYLEEHAPNLQLVGRNGMHHYNNQDHSMMSALCAARNIAVDARLDPWSVNTDAEYHEGTRDGEDTSGRLVPQRAVPAEK
jgi:protoporphyrinogen oxidase